MLKREPSNLLPPGLAGLESLPGSGRVLSVYWWRLPTDSPRALSLYLDMSLPVHQ